MKIGNKTSVYFKIRIQKRNIFSFPPAKSETEAVLFLHCYTNSTKQSSAMPHSIEIKLKRADRVYKEGVSAAR